MWVGYLPLMSLLKLPWYYFKKSRMVWASRPIYRVGLGFEGVPWEGSVMPRDSQAGPDYKPAWLRRVLICNLNFKFGYLDGCSGPLFTKFSLWKFQVCHELHYKSELCQEYWHEESSTPWAVCGNDFYTYDNARSLKLKVTPTMYQERSSWINAGCSRYGTVHSAIFISAKENSHGRGN